MEDIQLLESVERYIRGEMKPDERVYFEQLRKTNPEVDQLVVEHTLFIHQMNEVGELRRFKSALNEVHVDLAEKGSINSDRLKGRAKIVYLWKRYKRVATIAATIAGITTITISMLVWSLSPKIESSQVTQLVKEVKGLKDKDEKLENKDQELDAKIKNVDTSTEKKPTITPSYRFNGTGFLLDGKGYLVTNAHVVRNTRDVIVQNKKGDNFSAKVVFTDLAKDLVILKIDDRSFKPLLTIPYGISRSNSELAESIFTLGYPRNDEIVYGQGYLSAKTGFNGDTLSCQLAIAANPGNSGGPVLNHNGEVIGIISTRQDSAEGVVFAIKSRYIYNVLDQLKKSDTLYAGIKVSSNSLLKGMDRTQQVKKIENYIFMVKVN
ncbi:MAG TPA: S1C family serine protease [Chitinophagaceae bacterium]|nr:S1C family serine protease [Chitinophagaceae bacterium]